MLGPRLSASAMLCAAYAAQQWGAPLLIGRLRVGCIGSCRIIACRRPSRAHCVRVWGGRGQLPLLLHVHVIPCNSDTGKLNKRRAGDCRGVSRVRTGLSGLSPLQPHHHLQQWHDGAVLGLWSNLWVMTRVRSIPCNTPAGLLHHSLSFEAMAQGTWSKAEVSKTYSDHLKAESHGCQQEQQALRAWAFC